MERTLNLGILAHIDAGKTSLTERLLHDAGVIDEIGSVDDGSTRTDSLALERQRGITIKSAVVSFVVDGVTVNLIDTPGHPDFIAEVERVLGVLDGVVLVVSAVEGVQAQTRVLMRTLQRLRIPTLVFVNKLDRRGARGDELLAELARRLTPSVVAMGTPHGLGTADAGFTPYEPDGADRPELAELLAGQDDALLAAYVDEPASLTPRRLRTALAGQTARAQVHPVYFGSAITGAGVAELTGGIRELLPTAPTDGEGPVAGTVFKVERGPAGEKIAWVRMFSGTVRVRDRVTFRGTLEAKVTSVGVFEEGSVRSRDAVPAGRIGKLWGLDDVRIGDAIGDPPERTEEHFFAPPTLETVVVPDVPSRKGALHGALAVLAEQDPLINLRQDDLRGELYVSLYGEVQKEVIQATLADEFGLTAGFRETTTLHIERPVGSGHAEERIKEDGNPFLAGLGLRVEPSPPGSGVSFGLDVELGSMPYAFFAAVEETVRETLRQGPHGWDVPDAAVTVTHTKYYPRQSHAHATFDKSMSTTAGDFRGLTPLVLMDALRRAGTQVLEPMHRFRLEIPADTFGTLLPVLTRLRAVPQAPSLRGAVYVLEGVVPAARVHTLEQRLPGLTRGEGILEAGFSHYAPVSGPPPARARTDHDPLHRKEYLLRVLRRV
ncbi:Tetracycline resistance protein TetO [Streptomyces sp. RB5]|uniref:Tetracycline resistance protein TetO n=1 Tax=Streptomyces smaragdinus TaxID=2585196 RepID=A0A7K0CAT3_9ACTN|nr:TetM/TetW/TetO/TetS family tetracycline resistance ribosomal protection protein [Streptomyces smaragdinus]MQY10493.1 Tetracycline resistance protein TetO [Streptomyces smaragdinus]